MSNKDRDFDFHALWRENIERYAPKSGVPSAVETPCELAEQFSEKLDALIFTSLGASPSLSQLAQGKYLLQEEWQAWQKAIPSDHRYEARTERHHCVSDVYQSAYDRLHALHLRLHPPVSLFAASEQADALPTSTRRPRRSQVGRVLFGESE
jgi:hypothetical protein